MNIVSVGRGLLLSVALFLTSVGSALSFEAGESYSVGAYCFTENGAKTLSDAATSRGDEGYRDVMRSENSCFDSRMHKNFGVNRVGVTLVEKQWVMTHKNGYDFEFWTAKDSKGTAAYVWLLVSDDKV